MRKQRPQELEKWIGTVVAGRPKHEQHDAKSDLVAWIRENVRMQDRRAYEDFCVAELVAALEDGETDGRI